MIMIIYYLINSNCTILLPRITTIPILLPISNDNDDNDDIE